MRRRRRRRRPLLRVRAPWRRHPAMLLRCAWPHATMRSVAVYAGLQLIMMMGGMGATPGTHARAVLTR